MSSNNTKFALTNALKLFNDNNVNSSLEQLEEILKVYPDNKEALELIISINIKINDPINALKYINQSIHFFSSFIINFQLQLFTYTLTWTQYGLLSLQI